MIDQESDVEGGIAEPGDLAIEEHHALGADQDVFRAEIAVNQAQGGVGQAFGFLSEESLQGWMPLAGAQQIRLEAQLKKLGSGGKSAARFRIVPGMAMNGGEDGGGLERMIACWPACQQHGFPVLEIRP